MINSRPLAAAFFAAALLAPLTVRAQPGGPGESAVPHPPPNAGKGHQCFFVTDLGDWRAPNDHTILFRVARDQVIRLDTSSCPELTYIDPHLITHWRGTETVCSALDWQLEVAPDIHTPGMPCIVQKMTVLTPAEIAALPKKDLP